ncbi:MAG: 16S rRNA (cytidine(1402)-2'-O)-methyltransferase [Acidobacteriota bacterium]
MAGTLYVVGTPIGNLEDVTQRVLRVLRDVDQIACEDTRHTRKLLARHAIQARLISYHKFNERARVERLLECLRRGEDVALVSDSGTPALSDPGAILVGEAAAAGFRVVPIPGPSALAAAVCAAGFSVTRLTFVGFLPSRAAGRRRLLASLEEVPGVLVFFESPRRLAAALKDMASRWGKRRGVVAREMTKMHEEFTRGTLQELVSRLGDAPVRGEVTLVVEGAQEHARGRPGPDAAGAPAELGPLRQEVERRVRGEGLRRPAAIRAVARAHGLDPRSLYRALAGEKQAAKKMKKKTS